MEEFLVVRYLLKAAMFVTQRPRCGSLEAATVQQWARSNEAGLRRVDRRQTRHGAHRLASGMTCCDLT